MKILALVFVMTGIASQYAPGVMDRVINTRQAGITSYTPAPDLSRYDGFMAMEDCSELGNEYYIVANGNLELFLVMDCSGHIETSQWMTTNNIVIEIDYETAARWDTIGRGIQVGLYREVYRYECK